MNYISEINEFYDWLETNQLPKSAIALWHALMHINNKARWQETFAVAMSALESKTGFGRRELFDARNLLQQKGRLKWKQRGGSACAEYQMISFCVHIAHTTLHTTPETNRTQTSTQTPTINKQDETKQDETKKERARRPKEVLKNPFSENFLPEWERWKKYKKDEHRFSFKGLTSEQASIDELHTLSAGVEHTARKIIDQSIAKGWKGFFELKNQPNGTSQRPPEGAGANNGRTAGITAKNAGAIKLANLLRSQSQPD